MRVSSCFFFGCTLLMLSLATAYGQDTSFATGPQYLMLGSSLFARPIATPSLALPAPALEVGASNATESLSAGASTQTAVPVRHPDADLTSIYYGTTRSSVVEISFASASEQNPDRLPPSILENGVWQITTVQALQQRGYGITVAEAAVQGKARARHATRVYTNADLDRLHGGS
jgi:hypothetical protein